MIWFWGVLCTLALLILFFPFIFWIEFKAQFKGVSVSLRIFKKQLFSYRKKFGKEEDKSPAEKNEIEKIGENSAPAEQSAALKSEEDKLPIKETWSSSQVLSEPQPAGNPERTGNSTKESKESVAKTSSEELPESEKKRSLTDEEFWTLILTPEFDSRALWAVKGLLNALFNLFRIRFVDCFVEGIQMDYEKMGYGASINAFLKSYPYIGAWDFRMDWTHDHELRSEGQVRASVNLCRLLGLISAVLFYGGIVTFVFWRRRAKILKTGELPKLGFVRKKIVKMMSEED